MSFKPGHKKLGGRGKGSRNKDSIPLQEKAKELGVDPFEILLLFAKADWKALGYESETRKVYSKDAVNEELYIQPAVRAKAAGEACQYMYPKLKAIDHSHQIEAKVEFFDLRNEDDDEPQNNPNPSGQENASTEEN